jgi:ABC-type transporter lipoprotein component MlaA
MLTTPRCKAIDSMLVYRTGQYRVLPLITGFVVRDGFGRVLYRTGDVEVAVQTADEMAQADGCFDAVA